MTLDQALAEAYTSREDLQAAQAMVHAAEAGRQAAVGDGLPSLRVSGDLGRSSSAWDTLHGTYAVSAVVQVPIFQGGRVHGEVLQADAELKRQQAQVADLRARIEYEVRVGAARPPGGRRSRARGQERRGPRRAAARRRRRTGSPPA